MLAADFIRLQKYSAVRSPRWRYDRARQLLGARPRRKPAKADDRLTRRAVEFLDLWDSAPLLNRAKQHVRFVRQELFPRYPELYLAYELFVTDGCERARCALEARLLARQSDEEIADRLSTMPEAVQAYEQLFFNVRDRLDNRDYIVSSVLSPSLNYGYDLTNIELSAKFFGYFAGPQVLDFILHRYDSNLRLPAATDKCQEYLDEFFRGAVARRSAEVVNTCEITRYDVMQLFEIHANLIAVSTKAKEEADNLGVVEESVDLLLKALPWTAGASRRAALEHGPLAAYQGQAGELRSRELLAAAAGKLDGLPSLANFQVPDDRIKESEHGEPTE